MYVGRCDDAAIRAGTIRTPAPSLELPAAGGERRSLAEFHGRSDPIQMGGDFVVDRAGTLVSVNRMRSLHDRAHVQDRLAAVGTVTT